MFLYKEDNETLNDYIVRIGLKREELGLSWQDISDLVKKEFGIELSSNSVRKRYSRRFNSYYTVDSVPQKLIDKTELYKFQQEKTQLSNYYKVLSREETLKEMGVEAAKILAGNYPLKFDNLEKSFTSASKSAILLIGDWHYGVTIDSAYNIYDPVVCIDRVKKLITKVNQLILKNNVHHLYIINLGDMIAGNIHLPIRLNSITDVVSQTIHVSEIIARLIDNLSTQVSKIDYYYTLDNHSRIDPDKKNSLQLETLARITPWFLKERFKSSKTITIHENCKYTEDIVSFELNGYKILAVHGDKEKPQQAIDKLTLFTGEKQDLICLAHFHHFNCDEQNRTMLVSNGSLMGTDTYAMDLRLDSMPSQTLIISSEENVCESIMKINL